MLHKIENQGRGSYHKRDSLQSISFTTGGDDSIANDGINSPTTIINSIKTNNTPHIIEEDTPSTTNANNNNHTILNIGNQVKVTNLNHKHYGMQGVIIKQTRCFSTVKLVEDDEIIRIYHTSLALVDEDNDDIEDEDEDITGQVNRSMAVVSDCSDTEEDDDDNDEEEDSEEEEEGETFVLTNALINGGVEQVSLSSSTNNNIVNSMRQRNIELLQKNQLLEDSITRYREEARLVRTENEHFYDRLKCPYCFELEGEMYVLSCGHRICHGCIHERIVDPTRCPTCKKKLKKEFKAFKKLY